MKKIPDLKLNRPQTLDELIDYVEDTMLLTEVGQCILLLAKEIKKITRKKS